MESVTSLYTHVGMLLFVIGTLISFVFSCIFVLRAFRESILWGLACIFIPLAAFIYAIKYWQDVKRPVLGTIVGYATILIGAGVLSLAPEARKKALSSYERQRERVEALKTIGTEADETEGGRSRALQKQEKNFILMEYERARVAEYRQRATELYGFVQGWHKELSERRPGENATEREQEEFRVEHENYTGLLKEYKQAMEEMKKQESALAQSHASEKPPVEIKAPAPTVPHGEGLKP